MTESVHRITALTDLTPASNCTIERGAAYARAMRAQLDVLHVAEELPPLLFEAVEGHRRRAIDEYMEQLHQRLEQDEIRHAWHAIDGVPYLATLEWIREHNSNALLVAADAYINRRHRPHRLGSTAHKLARKSGLATFVIKSDEHPDPPLWQRVLVLTDLSEASRSACRRLPEILPAGTELTLMYCYELPPYVAGVELLDVPALDLEPIERDVRASATQSFNDFVDSLKDEVTFAATHVSLGLPVEQALHAIEEGDYDLVAVGSRGQNPAVAILLGSVAEGMLDLSPIDVLVIPTNGNA